MSMIFCESLFGITASILLALRLSCRITLYGLPSPMEAIWPPEWELRILGGAFQSSLWQVWLGVLFLWLLFFTMFAYVWLFCISLAFWSFFVSVQWLLSSQDRRGQVFDGGFALEGNLCIFFSTAWQSLWVWPTWAHSLQMIWAALQSLEK